MKKEKKWQKERSGQRDTEEKDRNRDREGQKERQRQRQKEVTQPANVREQGKAGY